MIKAKEHLTVFTMVLYPMTKTTGISPYFIMKKIINGKMYNTETATELGEFWNGLSASDFRNLSETLYRKKNGEFFLYGQGGAMTEYSQPVGDMTGGGEKIIPFTEEQARHWAEEKLDADEYIEIFGEPEE